MARLKTDNVYDTIKIPRGLTRIIDTIIKNSLGNFTSRTDLIKYTVRKYDDELKKEREEKNGNN